MKVYKKSRFPASKDIVYHKLTKLKTLQFIAKPYATFTPVTGNEEIIWQTGETFLFKFKLFGFIPLGIHTINVLEFDENHIYTHEFNKHVPIWNHRIVLKENKNGTTTYSDEVEIKAGFKTIFVYLWAKCFYAHRQKKWIKLLKQEKKKKI